jgi:hypothetical protein
MVEPAAGRGAASSATYRTVPYRTVLYCTVLYCTVLYGAEESAVFAWLLPFCVRRYPRLSGSRAGDVRRRRRGPAVPLELLYLPYCTYCTYPTVPTLLYLLYLPYHAAAAPFQAYLGIRYRDCCRPAQCLRNEAFRAGCRRIRNSTVNDCE